MCVPLTVGTGTTYELKAPTDFAGRVRQTGSNCINDVWYETKSPIPISDRECATLTGCGMEEYESRAGTTKRDRFEVPTPRAAHSDILCGTNAVTLVQGMTYHRAGVLSGRHAEQSLFVTWAPVGATEGTSPRPSLESSEAGRVLKGAPRLARHVLREPEPGPH